MMNLRLVWSGDMRLGGGGREGGADIPDIPEHSSEVSSSSARECMAPRGLSGCVFSLNEGGSEDLRREKILTNDKLLLTNQKKVLTVLTNQKRALKVSTNQKRVLKVLTNQRPVLPGEPGAGAGDLRQPGHVWLRLRLIIAGLAIHHLLASCPPDLLASCRLLLLTLPPAPRPCPRLPDPVSESPGPQEAQATLITPATSSSSLLQQSIF